ncbi:exodeoxyribonuclease V subunit alpha [Solirubrobacter ginsenosidimutans]|uniref:RecBCD enzyme subunit RecD n=1 Tax=Solirubrobacter ginsenosidimutans TaxID=490573 RepID=A0A9X3N383_9ACTN|nr:exodeoxyribonuclease V subunit alpha [Solirubrobacter ginsenosidimutans]MDA0166436.1 exodeoxyribonuclease V subunit alpha [Solirubrobacter ginsenosidimutans]
MSAVAGSPRPDDPYDVRRARHAPGLLRAFNDIGVLAAADVHVAVRLATITGETDETIALAAALAVRAPRLGHVFVDIATIHETATVESEEPVDLTTLPWPEVETWTRALQASPLVAVGEEFAESRPLRLVGNALYLDRYWREERQVAADLQALGGQQSIDEAVLADGIARVFLPRSVEPQNAPAADTPDALQRAAVATAVRRRFAVVAGGPGTGKTTTVARIVALLAEQAEAAGAPAPLIALAAPTGKAAARLEEAVHAEAAKLDVSSSVRDALLALNASTLHRLLGWRPDSHSRFRHNRGNRLPHDVVIVDETSMVSLSLMARLVEAVRPQARLVLVGDPGQLTSIEAGAVLGDIVRAGGDGVVVLEHVYRYGKGIDELAAGIRTGDQDAVIAALKAGHEDVSWIPVDVGDPASQAALAPVRDGAVSAARAVIAAARAGDADTAIKALGAFRVLCAHRRGAYGVSVWTARIEAWLAGELERGRWYPGRPLLVTENDYGLRLYNGDTGVVVATEHGRTTAAFERQGEVVLFPPARLGAVDTVYAMTVHKSQGSQFGTAAVLLPAVTSQVLTRELLYTAVTRAQSHLILAGTEETIRAAVARPVARASGLGGRL